MEILIGICLLSVGATLAMVSLDYKERLKTKSELKDLLAKIAEAHNGLMLRADAIQQQVNSLEFKTNSGLRKAQ